MSESLPKDSSTKFNMVKVVGTTVAGTLATVWVAMQIWNYATAPSGVELEVESDISEYVIVAPLLDAIDKTSVSLNRGSYDSFIKQLTEREAPNKNKDEDRTEKSVNNSSGKTSEKPPEKTALEKDLELQLSAAKSDLLETKSKHRNDMLEIGSTHQSDLSAVYNDLIRPTVKMLDQSTYDARSIHKIAFIKLTNSGDQTADNVALQLDGKGYAEIKREGRQTENLEFSNRVVFGDLAPNEKLDVTLWADGIYGPSGFTISHSNGKEHCSFPSKVTGFWAWISGNSPSAFFAVVFLPVVCGLLVFTYIASRIDRANSKGKEEEGGEEEEPSPES